MSQRSSTRAGIAVVAVSLACACTAPAVAQAQVPAPPPPTTISVTGTGTVKPTPLNRRSNASIAKAVRDAKAAATPLALADGRARAAILAAQTGLGLGALLGITEGSASAFPFFGPSYGQEGTFGPGRFCGTIRVPIFRRTANGGRRVVRFRSRHGCRVPAQVVTSLGMSFSTTPAPPA
ncbi:MAG TPA: hypothetical protein VGV90_18395 [Solirubrobacteraceae bacterium]|nr:hypothetical protein [Solirubrobacteraceae bacterium]